MKIRTRWIIGITTAIITVAGLNAVFGSRYRMHEQYTHPCCMRDTKNADGRTPASEVKKDTATWR